jgi:hypothetical protein
VIHLRNLDPRRSAYLPVAPGWCRVVLPQACASVPAATLRSAAVQRALAAEQLAVVTEINGSADARAVAALRRDMAIAIARAEQREFDRLRQGVSIRPRRKATGRYQRWTPERLSRFRQLWLSGAPITTIAQACKLAHDSVLATGYARGLPPRRSRLQAPAEAA